MTQWTDARFSPPREGVMVRVIYDDGLECNASRASGRIYYPQGDSMYRYVDVARWRELTAEERIKATATK